MKLPQVLTLDHSCYQLSGELVFDNAKGALAVLRDIVSPDADKLLDLRGLTRVDSAGIAVLIELSVGFLSKGKRLSFSHASEQIHMIANISGLQQMALFELS